MKGLPRNITDIYQVKRPNQEQTLSTINDIISQKKELLNGYYNKLKNGYDIDASLNELIMKNDISIEDLKVLKSMNKIIKIPHALHLFL